MAEDVVVAGVLDVDVDVLVDVVDVSVLVDEVLVDVDVRVVSGATDADVVISEASCGWGSFGIEAEWS